MEIETVDAILANVIPVIDETAVLLDSSAIDETTLVKYADDSASDEAAGSPDADIDASIDDTVPADWAYTSYIPMDDAVIDDSVISDAVPGDAVIDDATSDMPVRSSDPKPNERHVTVVDPAAPGDDASATDAGSDSAGSDSAGSDDAGTDAGVGTDDGSVPIEWLYTTFIPVDEKDPVTGDDIFGSVDGTDMTGDGSGDLPPGIYTMTGGDGIAYTTSDGPGRSSDPLPYERNNSVPDAAPQVEAEIDRTPVNYAPADTFHTGLDLL